MKKVKSLNFYMAAILLFISIFSIGTVSLISNIGTSLKFKKYIKEKHDKRNQIILNILKESYSKNGYFEKKSLALIDMYSMMDNLKVTIYNEQQNILWSVNYIGHSMSIDNLATVGTYIAPDAKLNLETIDINLNSKKIGTVVIEYDGKYALSQSDINFLSEFNNWIIFSGIISILLSLLLSRIFAKEIASPINLINETAKKIGNGEVDIKLQQSSNIKEALELTETINKMAASLNEQKKLRKQLVSDMSHEIRTPLSTIQSHMEALIDKIWEPTISRLESIYEEIKRLSKLVKEIEKIDELEDNLLTLDKTVFNINESVNSVVENFKAEAFSKNIAISVDIPATLSIEADIDKFKQLVINIISNSIKYSNYGGNITVSFVSDNSKKLLTFRDNGIGISEEHLPYIFERFYRADSSRTRKTGGTGIGLAVVKSIADAHKWKLSVESRENSGCSITIEFQ